MQNRMETLRLFLAAAEARSFRRAAARCEVSPQTVTRAVQALEQALGEVLFHRSTRAVRLSDAGERLAERARTLVGDLDALFDTRSPAVDDPFEGLVRIAAPTIHGRRFVMPVLEQLHRRHPRLRFDLRLSDEVKDPVLERIDIGLRGGHVANSRLVARPVKAVPNVICASPTLLARIGSVTTLDELRCAPTTQLLDRRTGRPWPWMLDGEIDFEPRYVVFCTDDPVAESDAVVGGMGIGQLSSALAQPHLARGDLVEVLPHVRSQPWPLTVYRVRREPVPPRVQVTYRALVDALAA